MSQRKIKNGAAGLDVMIVGAGFAGLYQLRELRKRGYNVRVIEAGNDIGIFARACIDCASDPSVPAAVARERSVV